MSDRNLTIDGVVYSLSDLPENAQAQIANITFCDERIRQLRSEWAVADTARLGYWAALKRELAD